MGKLDEAKQILKAFGMPAAQQADVCVCSLLALAKVWEGEDWNSATNEFIRIHDIIQFATSAYGKTYAENSRETFRKQAMHAFRLASIIEDNNLATNSPNYRYRITEDALDVIKSFGSRYWDEKIKHFREQHNTLIEKYSHKRKMSKIPVLINNEEFEFSTGKHNELQKLIIEEFAPRFAPNAKVLYVGDTQNKNLIKESEELKNLGVLIGDHEKLPDVILYKKDSNWLYFIEAVTSVGPMNPKRIIEINQFICKMCGRQNFCYSVP